MTKSQNTKSEQLTEQWKKGELPAGYYYVKNEFNNIFPSDYSESYDSINDAVIKDFFTEVSEITEVIAKVPSYEEWQAKLEENAQLKERVSKLEKMQYSYTPEEWNTMLRTINRTKELLEECELWFTGIVGNMNDKNVGEHNKSVPIGNFEYVFKEFSQKINEALK